MTSLLLLTRCSPTTCVFLENCRNQFPRQIVSNMVFAIDIYGKNHTMTLFPVLISSRFDRESDDASSTNRTSHAG